MDKLKALYRKHRDLVSYLFFGGLTTLINIVCYKLLRGIWPLGSTVGPNAIAQILSILFAYYANRKWVFRSTTRGTAMLREMLAFFAARAFSFVLDLGLMVVSVDLLALPDLPMKILVNILVIVLNYLFSKFFIFGARRKNSA